MVFAISGLNGALCSLTAVIKSAYMFRLFYLGCCGTILSSTLYCLSVLHVIKVGPLQETCSFGKGKKSEQVGCIMLVIEVLFMFII